MMLTFLTFFLIGPILDPGPDPARRKFEDLPADIQAIVERMDAANKSTQTIKADFVQKKELSLLAEPMSLTGKFFLKKGVGMKFEFASPENLEIFFTTRKIVSIAHNERTASFKKLPKRKNDLTEVLLTEKIDKLLEYFSLSQIPPEEEGNTAILLTPEKRKMKKRFREIRLFLKPDGLVRKISVVEHDGDYFEVVLSNTVVNSHLEDTVFEPDIPTDYQTGTSLDPILGTQIGL